MELQEWLVLVEQMLLLKFLELINSYLEKYEKLDSVPEIKPLNPVSVTGVRY